MARPSTYSDEIAELICEELAEGKSLRTICSGDEMPNISTVMRWLADEQQQHEGFANRYARAREIQADVMDAMILDVAEACKPDTAAADRVKIDAYKWRASKLKPKVYGDKQQIEHSGNVTLGDALRGLGSD